MPAKTSAPALSALVSCLAVVVTLGSWSNAQQIPANQLLRAVLDHELKAQAEDHTYWTYRLSTSSAGHPRTYKVVESVDGDIRGLVAIDGHPLTPAEQRKEEQRIAKLVSHPEQQRKLKRDQDQDARRAEHMLKVLPDAVKASYRRTSYGQTSGDLTELEFKPNPAFHPSSHEDQVFHAMEGKIWLNTKENRLAQIDGHLLHTVKFAGGLLGHLDQGGNFQVKQSEVGPGHWEVTAMHIDMRGKALFFKTIAVRQDESREKFSRLSNEPTLSQAGAELRRQMQLEGGAADGKSAKN